MQFEQKERQKTKHDVNVLYLQKQLTCPDHSFLFRSFSQTCKRLHLVEARQLIQQLNSVGKYTAQILKYAIIQEFCSTYFGEKEKKNVPVPGTLASVPTKALTDEEFAEFTACIQAQFQEFPRVSLLNCRRPLFQWVS